MFERFTGKARRTVVLAQEEARQLQHNYIGTEHILLGLLGEPEGNAARVLEGFGIERDGIRQEVVDMIGRGKEQPSGHIPFTPRAKKTLEYSLREALSLNHHYIGTEHILLGLIREGEGVAAQMMRKHAGLLDIRMAVMDAVPPGQASEGGRIRRWARRLTSGDLASGLGSGDPSSASLEGSGAPAEETTLSATPAADTTLSEAARLAGAQPVGSHHLLLAALADPNSAAARVLANQLGVDIDRAKEALRGADVTGTSDEQPEDAGRRQMVIQVSDELLTVTAADPLLVKAGNEALSALGDKATAGTIAGADLRGAAAGHLAQAWQSLNDALAAIQRTPAAPAPEQGAPEQAVADNPDKPNDPGAEQAG